MFLVAVSGPGAVSSALPSHSAPPIKVTNRAMKNRT
jgi:hypothetical protein